MASAQQLIGLVKSHAEGDESRFFDLAMQLAAAEDQKGHRRLAEQLRQWAEAGKSPPQLERKSAIPIIAPRGDLSGLLNASYPTYRFSDVILPPSLSDEMLTVVQETRMTAKLEESGLKPRRRILLSGPPGTGKTMSAAALAGELKFPLFSVMLHGLITKFMGETATKLRMVFDAVRTTRGVYLFDEIDALASSRSAENDVGEARRILNSFLQFLDEDTGPSIVIATTNLPEILDRAILRRFDLVLQYQLPIGKDIEKAMKRRLSNFNTSSIKWPEVSVFANGLSTADVVAAGEDAARRAVLDGSIDIETISIVAALDRRKQLHGLGTGADAKRTSASGGQQHRTGQTVRKEGRRGQNTSK
jgi:hypothetical protein